MAAAGSVERAVLDRWGVSDRRGKTNRWWSEFFWESGWARMENKLNTEEFEEFLRLCDVSGVAKSNEFNTFRTVVKLMSRYGDDGYGDRPADMTRVVYWFQHVGNVPAPPPTNTPELIQEAARRLARDRERSPRR
jgi:hypothetical protein